MQHPEQEVTCRELNLARLMRSLLRLEPEHRVALQAERDLVAGLEERRRADPPVVDIDAVATPQVGDDKTLRAREVVDPGVLARDALVEEPHLGLAVAADA